MCLCVCVHLFIPQFKCNYHGTITVPPIEQRYIVSTTGWFAGGPALVPINADYGNTAVSAASASLSGGCWSKISGKCGWLALWSTLLSSIPETSIIFGICHISGPSVLCVVLWRLSRGSVFHPQLCHCRDTAFCCGIGKAGVTNK